MNTCKIYEKLIIKLREFQSKYSLEDKEIIRLLRSYATQTEKSNDCLEITKLEGANGHFLTKFYMAGFRKLDDFIGMTEHQILQKKGIGAGCLHWIMEHLRNHYDLKDGVIMKRKEK